MKRFLSAVLVVGFLAATSSAATYLIDPNHSSVTFAVKHIVGKVRGHFDVFSGTFEYDAAKPEKWGTTAIIGADSINTGNQKRDSHLKSPDFLDAMKFPNITFKSTKLSDFH